MKKTKKILIYIFTLAIILAPFVSLAASDLIPCGTDKNPQDCGFIEFMQLINNVIDFALYKLALPVAAIMFAYAGISLVVAGGAEGKTKAKNIFMNTVIGLVLAAGAWIIVKTLLSIAGYTDIGLFFKNDL